VKRASRLSLPAVLSLVGWTLAASGCVVTTFEGPGEAPRVPPPPERPNSSAGQGDGTFAEMPAQNEGEVRARHLLVQFVGSERAGPAIKRTRDEAKARAEEALARARKGEDFAGLVKEYSDEPGAGERGGDLGRFNRRMMVKEFSNAAFALEPGAISEVVETAFGFHVIQRTE